VIGVRAEGNNASYPRLDFLLSDIMSKSIIDNKKKKGAGRPRVGATLIGVRVPPAGLAELDSWIKENAPDLSRPEAIRRLIEIGLGSGKPTRPRSAKSAERAKQLAAKTIDRLVDPAVAEAGSRKRRLLKGPDEFREVRVDQGRKPDPPLGRDVSG
jgi:hypothetical protein